MKKEIFKDILGYSEFYSVSNYGNVFSKRQNKNLSFGDNGKGYLFVNLYNNGISKRFYVHRLVALTFIDNLDNKKQVNHKDCNKSNNYLSNLEWITPEENINHAVLNKRFYTSDYQKKQTSLANRGSKSHLTKLSEIDVLRIKIAINTKFYTQKEIAEIYNTTRGNISAISRGKSWKHI